MPTTPKPKILIIEDDPFSVQLLRHNLKNYPAEILPPAATAADALRTALEYEPDVALVDIYLTGESDGLEAARAIQEHFDIPIIYLTGYQSDEVFESAKATDPFGYILKPFTPKELTVTLDMALYKHAISKELKASKALLSTTLDALGEAIVTTDGDWKVVYANPVSTRWLGVQKDEDFSQRMELSDPETGEKIAFDPSLFMDARGPVCLLKSNHGEDYVRISILTLPKGQNGYVAVLWDVTQEYKANQEAAHVYRAMETLEEGLLILHPKNGKILFASKGFEKMTGWGASEVLGESPDFLFGSKSSLHFWRDAQDKLIREGHVKAESSLYSKDGKELLAQWQISRMTTGNTAGEGQLMVFLRDITLQRNIEEELRQSQKIEAVGRLAGGVAHDFNNLLSVINSYADLMTLKIPEGDPLLKYVNNIRAAGQRATDLVAKLLTFSRRDAAKPEMLDVRSVTDDIEKMLRRVIRENIEIKLDYGENLGALWGDQLQLEQIIMNLCVNARDAIQGQGRITVGWHMNRLEQDEAAKKKISAGDYLEFTVSDTGSGIEPAVLQKIFEPYFTTKTSGKGTGLGLSIVYAIVKQLKGAIEVESRLGQGTTFRIFFPASQRAAGTKAAVKVIEPPTLGNEHILIVEDEENFAECMVSLLSLHGYKVHHAKDMQGAQEIFDNAIYPIRLLITDVMLPGVSGQALATRLKEKSKDLSRDLKVIFITGYDNALKILQDFPYTALVLQKPFSVVSILNKIREVLDNPQEDKQIKIV